MTVPAKTKITEEIAKSIEKLACLGNNPTFIGKKLNLSKDTIKNFIIKNNLPLNVRKNEIKDEKRVESERIFMELLPSALSLKDIQKKGGMHYTVAVELAKKHAPHLLRNRSDAAKKRRMSVEEAQVRVPGGSTVIAFDETLKKFIIKDSEGNLHTKSQSKLRQGKKKEPVVGRAKNLLKVKKNNDKNKVEQILKNFGESYTANEIKDELSKNGYNFCITYVRGMLRKLNLNYKKIDRTKDRSRKCAMCGSLFTPQYGSSVDMARYIFCSDKCLSKRKATPRVYDDKTAEKVLKLRKEGKFINEIVKVTGIGKSTIIGIFEKNDLMLSKEEKIARAYLGRTGRTMEEYKSIVEEIKRAVSNSEGSISYFQNKYGVSGLHDKFAAEGLDDLINSVRSTGEMQVGKFLKSLNVEFEQNTRSILSKLELDFFIPSKMIAIEYNGLYWHSELQKTPKYHLEKTKACRELGIQLIQIFEDEWLTRQAQIEGRIKSILGISDSVVYGRDCAVEIIDNNISKEFLNSYHVQGSTNIRASFGLFDSNRELIGVMTLSDHHRGNADKVAILSRLAFKAGVNAIGGSSKLLKLFKKHAKENNYTKIISWSDNRWSEGKVYQAMGFKMDKELPIDYSYTKNFLERISKQSCKKADLIKKGGCGNTEKELAASLGYVRVWDCGKKRWTIDL